MKKTLSLILAMIMMLSISAAAIGATNDTSISDKKIQYEQYQVAVKEAIEKYDARIELKPFEQFDFSIAAPIEEFKATLKAFGESQMNSSKTRLNDSNALTLKEYQDKVSKIQPMAYKTKTKSDNVSVGTKSVKINITAELETFYNDSYGRQMMSSNSYVSDISSATSGYTWSSNFIDQSLIDGGRTFYVVAQGEVDYSNMSWYDLEVSVEYYCSATGKIS